MRSASSSARSRVVSVAISPPNPGAGAALRFRRVRRLLLLSLEEFGASTLEAEAARYAVTPAELGRHAVRYYLSDRGSGRMALRVPRLSTEAARKPAMELTLDLDAECWNELEGGGGGAGGFPASACSSTPSSTSWRTSTPAEWSGGCWRRALSLIQA